MVYASAIEHKRDMVALPGASRRRCHCGCDKRATHRGTANGVGMTTGCELYIRRWVRDGINASRIKSGRRLMWKMTRDA